MSNQQILFTNREIEKMRDDINEEIRCITQSLKISLNVLDSQLEKIPIILEKVRDIEDRLFGIENRLPPIDEDVISKRCKEFEDKPKL